MAAFAEAAFNTDRYASSRPTYPRELFEFVFDYHKRSDDAKWDVAIDLGCGPGQATAALTPFKRIIGIDSSTNMITRAQESIQEKSLQIEFVQANVENLHFLEDGTVDLMIAAQACHWFDWEKAWPEFARVLRKGGSAAFWVYTEFRLPKYPALSPLIDQFVHGEDTLGSYWQQPGRDIVDDLLTTIPKATDVVPGKYMDWEHVFFTGAHHAHVSAPRPALVCKTTTWDGLLGNVRTWSASHTYQKRHPGDDISGHFIRSLMDATAKDTGTMPLYTDTVDAEWPLAMVLVRRA